MYERFIARQPILDGKLKLCGYELLFRARDDNRAGVHPDATGQLISSSTMLFDWDGLLGGVSAHINFGAAELLSGVALLLPGAQTVVEIPATLEYTDDLLQAVKNLRQAGYRVALDGYERQRNLETVLRHADFVKVDFFKVGQAECESIRHELARGNAKLIAKKIETWQGFETARRMGYELFQGHFFLEPQVLKRREIAGTKLRCLELLRLVQQRPLDLARVEAALKQEPALMYKLLRYLNSPLMGRQSEIQSVQNAIALIGEDEFRRWASLVAVVLPAADKPTELVRTALTRAFFCEALARAKRQGARSDEYFLVGLFSVMSAILDRPLKHILTEVAVGANVRDALLGTPNELRFALDAARAFEQGQWEEFTEAMDALRMEEGKAPEYLAEANRMAKEVSQ